MLHLVIEVKDDLVIEVKGQDSHLSPLTLIVTCRYPR